MMRWTSAWKMSGISKGEVMDWIDAIARSVALVAGVGVAMLILAEEVAPRVAARVRSMRTRRSCD